MVVKHGKERRMVTLPVEVWEYLDQKAQSHKNLRFGRWTVSKELEKLVITDKQLAEAGFLDK